MFGVLGVLVTLAWLEFLDHRERRAQLRRDCEGRGHQWKAPAKANFAVNPDYSGWIRYCRHCGRQEHQKTDGSWR